MALLVFKINVVVKCVAFLLFTAAVYSFNETAEVFLANWGSVEDIVEVVVDDVVGGWGPHLTLSSLYL